MVRKFNFVTVAIIAAGSWFLVLLTLWTTTPAALKPAGVTFWFLIVLVALSSGLAVIIDVLKRLIGPKKPQGRAFKPSLRQGILLGVWLTIMLALASLRQFSIRDALLIGLLFAIIEFYLRLTT